MKPFKERLIVFLAGGMVVGGAVGAWGYLNISARQSEVVRLRLTVKKQIWQEENLNKSYASLKEELNWLKEKKAQSYDQTIGALMQATDNAPIEALYELGVKALQEKDPSRAYFALAQVHKANPEYKEIAKHYPMAQKAHEHERQKQMADKLKSAYAQGYDQQAKGLFAQAKANYQRVMELNPLYKDTQKRLNTVSQYLAVREQSREFEQRKQWLEASYKLGVNAQIQGRYAQAKETFAAIVSYAPKYKDAAQRLKVVLARLPKTQPLNATASDPHCYEKGVAFGKCASLGSGSSNCGQADLSQIPAGCKDNPAFAKGLKSGLSSAGRGTGGEGNEPSTADLFKGLPSLLKDL